MAESSQTQNANYEGVNKLLGELREKKRYYSGADVRHGNRKRADWGTQYLGENRRAAMIAHCSGR